MTLQEAKDNIGKPFKVIDWTCNFDTIQSVDDQGKIHGEWLIAHHTDCQLKQEQPNALKQHSKRRMDLRDIPGFPDTDSNGMCYSDADPGL